MRDSNACDSNAWNSSLTSRSFYSCRLKIFKQRKPDLTKEWQHKLPDFVLRLEEAVYRGARSKVRSLSDRL